MRVFIHTGTLSVDNGARGPITRYFELAKAIGISPDTGNHYGDDSLEISDSDWPTVQQLLEETKMLYRVEGTHRDWQNVLTDAVRARLPYQAPILH